MNQTPISYNELKAHYLAVKKRLGGLGPSAGLVPIAAVARKPDEVAPVVEKSKIVWDIPGFPKNQFFHMMIDVAKKHHIDPKLLVGSSRKIEIVRVRRELVYLAFTEGKYSASQIGRWLKKDHTTILHDINCWERDHELAA